MSDRLLEFIHTYQARVKEAVALLQNHKQLDNPMYWRQAAIDQEGFLDSDHRIAYYFHGSGCRVTWPSGEVDWDFGHDGRLDGLDPWFLWCFAEHGTDRFPEFKDKSKLDEAFATAVNDGILHRPFTHLQDNLFYLR
jgi:hypothetical protein